MSRKRQYEADPRPKNEPARNRVRGIVGPKPEATDLDGEIGSESHKKQALRYFQGNSRAGRSPQFRPGDINGQQMGMGSAGDPGKADYPPSAGGPGNDLHEVIDRSTKMPWGGDRLAWAKNTGKLGHLDPQETDQPSWVNTWSPLQEGPNGAGPVRDENYGVQRPRTQSRQQDAFDANNPEFQNGAEEGDWTNYEFNPNV